jgi:hypothetical protein
VGRVNFTLFKGMVCRTRLLAVSIMLTLAASGLSGLRLRTKAWPQWLCVFICSSFHARSPAPRLALSPNKVYRSLVNYLN